MTPQTPPKSDLPPLNLGSGDELQNRLDALASQGGAQAVARWVEKELQPGRTITYAGQTVVLQDRSVWRADAGGHPSAEALLRPLTDEHSGKLLGVWARPLAKEPFVLRLRKAQ